MIMFSVILDSAACAGTFMRWSDARDRADRINRLHAEGKARGDMVIPRRAVGIVRWQRKPAAEIKPAPRRRRRKAKAIAA
jgi:hypothetical protein